MDMDAKITTEPTATTTQADDLGDLLELLERFGALPDAVKTFFDSKAAVEAVDRVTGALGLPPASRGLVAEAAMRLIVGALAMPDLPTALVGLTDGSADRAKARDASVDLLGRLALPLQAFLGDVTGAITGLGGDPSRFSDFRVEERVISYDSAADRIAGNFIPGAVAADRRQRLVYIIETCLRGVRSDEDTVEQLRRSVKVGGLDLDEATAKRVVDLTRAEMRMTRFVEAGEGKKEATNDGAAAHDDAPAPTETVSPEAIKGVYLGSADEREELSAAIGRFRRVTDGDFERVRDAFFEVLYPPDGEIADTKLVVAGAYYLAELGEITGSLRYDERYRQILLSYYADHQMTGAAEAFAADPVTRESVNVYLQIILRAFATLDEAESARHGLHVINLMKKEGISDAEGLVAFDQSRRAFRWLRLIEL
jgi:hypothetical protein